MRTIAVEINRDARLRPAGAKIRLKGQWLADTFAPGTRVEVQAVPGGLLLRPVQGRADIAEVRQIFARIGL